MTSELFSQLDEDVKETSKKEISSTARKTTTLQQFLFTVVWKRKI